MSIKNCNFFLKAPSGGITGGLCPKGGYCFRGAKKASPCPIGKYNSDEGAKSPADCLDCKAGYHFLFIYM